MLRPSNPASIRVMFCTYDGHQVERNVGVRWVLTRAVIDTQVLLCVWYSLVRMACQVCKYCGRRHRTAPCERRMMRRTPVISARPTKEFGRVEAMTSPAGPRASDSTDNTTNDWGLLGISRRANHVARPWHMGHPGWSRTSWMNEDEWKFGNGCLPCVQCTMAWRVGLCGLKPICCGACHSSVAFDNCFKVYLERPGHCGSSETGRRGTGLHRSPPRVN